MFGCPHKHPSLPEIPYFFGSFKTENLIQPANYSNMTYAMLVYEGENKTLKSTLSHQDVVVLKYPLFFAKICTKPDRLQIESYPNIQSQTGLCEG